MARRPERAGEAIHAQLMQLVRRLLADKPGGHLIERELDALDLPSLRIGGPEDAERFARALIDHLDGDLDAAIQRATTVRPGRAFCHRCGGADCVDAEVPGPRDVFIGYTQTGQPLWQDFAQFCLDLKHPDVQSLYAERPALLTVAQPARELHVRMIDAFERSRYRLLGQVVAGFLPLPGRELPGRPVVALTFQAGMSVGRDQRRRFALNVLGRGPDQRPLAEWWESEQDFPWRRAVRWGAGALETLPRRGREANPAMLEERALGILNGLARRLRQDGRSRSRRTRHAEARHASGDRPTRKAVDDVRAARPEVCLVDRRSDALVILGERGRTHFFARDGRLVSSVRYSRDAIDRKRRTEQWVPAAAGELEQLQRRLPN